jgi:hypothetical protein
MGSPQIEELKHIILQHVAEGHRERALLLLKAIEQRRSVPPSCFASRSAMVTVFPAL